MGEQLSNLSAASIVAAAGSQTREVLLLDSNREIVARSDTIQYNVTVERPVSELAELGRVGHVPSDAEQPAVGQAKPFEQVLTEQEPLTSKYVITGKHGSVEYVSIDGKPVAGETEKTLGLFSINIITRERGRKEERDRLKTIVEAIGDPIYVCDTEPKFTYVNDAFADLTGYSKAQLHNAHPSLIKPHRSQEKIRQALREILSDTGGDEKTVEVDITTKDGDRIRCEDHVGVLLNDGEFNGAAGALRDISERKERSDRLEEQNEQLERFTSVLTHDLRNPLNIIEGYATRIKTEETAEDVERIERAVSRMRAIIDDTLALYEEGKHVEQYDTISLDKLAIKAWENVATEDATISIADRIEIKGDADRISRLLENLYRNAVEHNDDPVTVEIGEYAPIGTTTRDSRRGFYVADSGSGISSDKRDAVFDFGETSSPDGTGLGLPIVKRVAEAHGWEIKLMDSTTGGAKFVFVDVAFVDR